MPDKEDHMLGLKRSTVQLVPHARAWADAFDEEHARLRDALGAMPCRIEHIGSTAVPGLCAKPILDIALGRPTGVEVPTIVPVIERLGYVYRGKVDPQLVKTHDHYLFIRETAARVRTHHVHCVPIDGPEWEAYLLLRDLLRQDGDARTAYEAAKRQLAAAHADDQRSYTTGKDQIVERLLNQARNRRFHDASRSDVS